MVAEARRWTTPTSGSRDGGWDGTRLPGEQFTEEQKATMMRRTGRISGWDVRDVKIRTPRERTLSERQWGMPEADAYVESVVSCPIVSRGMNADQIIKPAGGIEFLPVSSRKRKRRT